MRAQLVGRKNCHLCGEAAAALRSLGTPVEELDVDADPELFRLYDFRVPVLLIDGRVVGEGRLTEASLRSLLARG